MYVNDPTESVEKEGKGLLRLHSTYRHDLKCYTSDEGRCQKTAASFLKGLLDFEGALAPILAIMVRNDAESNRMLDDSSAAQEVIDSLKGKLNELFHYDGEDMLGFFRTNFEENPPNIVIKTLRDIKNPYRLMQIMQSLINKIIEQIEHKLKTMGIENELMESYRQTDQDFDTIFHQVSNEPSSPTPIPAIEVKIGGLELEGNM